MSRKAKVSTEIKCTTHFSILSMTRKLLEILGCNTQRENTETIQGRTITQIYNNNKR